MSRLGCPSLGPIFINSIFPLSNFSEPTIPHIKDHEFIKTVFPVDYSNVLWLHAAHTFPLFCCLLELPDYTETLIVGLIASIGQLTESLVSRHAAAKGLYSRPRIHRTLFDPRR